MISLNDYLYEGDTVLKILHNFKRDLMSDEEKGVKKRASAARMDLLHAAYIDSMIQILEHNEFLTSQSQRIREFYKYMADQYPYLAFTFKGRIKSVLRAEAKFDRKMIKITDDLYREVLDAKGIRITDSESFTWAASHLSYEERINIEGRLTEKIMDIKDLIAYRIILSVPKCHVPEGADRTELEVAALYEIAELLPDFLQNQHFKPEKISFAKDHPSPRLSEKNRDYYKDYVTYPRGRGYESLHIVLYDEVTGYRFEIQLRTKDMDDTAEIGTADHFAYETSQAKQKEERLVPPGVFAFYDEAYERLEMIENIELSKLDVNMFTARSNILMNDGCGLYRGRLILPYEHLSRFQNDLVD